MGRNISSSVGDSYLLRCAKSDRCAQLMMKLRESSSKVGRKRANVRQSWPWRMRLNRAEAQKAASIFCTVNLRMIWPSIFRRLRWRKAKRRRVNSMTYFPVIPTPRSPNGTNEDPDIAKHYNDAAKAYYSRVNGIITITSMPTRLWKHGSRVTYTFGTVKLFEGNEARTVFKVSSSGLQNVITKCKFLFNFEEVPNSEESYKLIRQRNIKRTTSESGLSDWWSFRSSRSPSTQQRGQLQNSPETGSWQGVRWSCMLVYTR